MRHQDKRNDIVDELFKNIEYSTLSGSLREVALSKKAFLFHPLGFRSSPGEEERFLRGSNFEVLVLRSQKKLVFAFRPQEHTCGFFGY